MGTYNADGTLKTRQELAAELDRYRARVLARQALRAAEALGKAFLAEGVAFDHMVDAVGYLALSLRRSSLRYAWLLDMSKGTPGVWCYSARGLGVVWGLLTPSERDRTPRATRKARGLLTPCPDTH